MLDQFRTRLPIEIVDELYSLTTHREWGGAVENMCVQLFELDITPSADEIVSIKDLCDEMKLSADTWQFLST
ncbi:MafI family immunity protein [Yoonia sp. I 8.24]|nr:MafI family immunity protein [Yoonia sp. I 8.24]